MLGATQSCLLQHQSANSLPQSAQESLVKEGTTTDGTAVKEQPGAQPKLAAQDNPSQAGAASQPENTPVGERQAYKTTNGDNSASVKPEQQTDSTSSKAEEKTNTSDSSSFSNLLNQAATIFNGYDSLITYSEVSAEKQEGNPKSETPSQAGAASQSENTPVAERQAYKTTNGDNSASVKPEQQTDSTSSKAEEKTNTSDSSSFSNLLNQAATIFNGYDSLITNSEVSAEKQEGNPKSETPSQAGQPSASAPANAADESKEAAPQDSLARTDMSEETSAPASSARTDKPEEAPAQASSEGAIDPSTTQNTPSTTQKTTDGLFARLNDTTSSQKRLQESLTSRSAHLEGFTSKSLNANEKLRSQYEKSQAKLTEATLESAKLTEALERSVGMTEALERSVGMTEHMKAMVADLQEEVSEIKLRDGHLWDLVRENAKDGTRRAELNAEQVRNANEVFLSQLSELEPLSGPSLIGEEGIGSDDDDRM
ncbi:hypothetical protein [uncultured Endozoicomonas sp.]|uniref:hypothetical protein n=1 Tax=uncultured Endozoicomonas sp. TaxID=432652 RepID=UPI0026354EEE|nr:hypothetical protein [uncultured Endozoicomonas sp.]